jgi:hypothetical protein
MSRGRASRLYNSCIAAFVTMHPSAADDAECYLLQWRICKQVQLAMSKGIPVATHR